MREEIALAKKNLEELDTVTEEDSSEVAKYDLLVKRDQDMTAFIDSFPATRAGILAEQQTAQDTIVLLLEDISKGLEDSTNMPNQETHAEMEEAMVSAWSLNTVVCCFACASTSPIIAASALQCRSQLDSRCCSLTFTRVRERRRSRRRRWRRRRKP
jgi:hypothetical protein